MPNSIIHYNCKQDGCRIRKYLNSKNSQRVTAKQDAFSQSLNGKL